MRAGPSPPSRSTASSSPTTGRSASPAARRRPAGSPAPSRRRRSALALETVGTCDALFQMVLAYVKDRKQFGVPIGSFQAIKHKMSNMFLAIERARALCYFAVAAIDEDTPDRASAVSMAKAASDDCQQLVCRESHPVLRRHRLHLGARRPPLHQAGRDQRRALRRLRRALPRRRAPACGVGSALRRAGRLVAVRPGESLIAALDLAPHPEGGWYRRTWVADAADGRAARRQRHLLPPPGGRGLGAAPDRRHRALALLRRRPARAQPRVARRTQRRARCSGPTSPPARRPRSSSRPVSGSRPVRSGASPSWGRP